jgi:hypothetical protein
VLSLYICQSVGFFTTRTNDEYEYMMDYYEKYQLCLSPFKCLPFSGNIDVRNGNKTDFRPFQA